jgi:hypothetical protein
MTQADSPMRWRERASPTPLARQTVSLWRFVARWDGGVLGGGVYDDHRSYQAERIRDV